MSRISGLYLYFIAVIGYVLTPVSCPRLECNYTLRYIYLRTSKKPVTFTVQFVQVVILNEVGGREWTVWTCKTLLCRQTIAINTNITDSQSADVWVCCELNPHGVGEYSNTMF